MATKHRRRSIAGDHTAAVLLLTLLYIFAADGVQAQSPPNGSNSINPNYSKSPKLNPSIAIIVVVLFSAFLLLGLFAIYIHKCGSDRMGSLAAAVRALSGRQRGLDLGILETLPVLVYSEVMEHKIGKGALECAVCLNEFEDEDAIRLLPKCDHVFHIECIDAWLATHVTCPVCRANYAADAGTNEGETDAPDLTAAAESIPVPDPPPPATDLVVIAVDDGERKQEMMELARIASRVRRKRSHSTGHSMTRQGSGLDRYTLRLPENVRKDIIAAGMVRRQGGLAAARGGGEDGVRRGWSVRVGVLDRWPSFIVRSVSATIPAWGGWKRGEKGSVKEGSMVGEFAGGGVSKKNSDDSESSTVMLNRV